MPIPPWSWIEARRSSRASDGQLQRFDARALLGPGPCSHESWPALFQEGGDPLARLLAVEQLHCLVDLDLHALLKAELARSVHAPADRRDRPDRPLAEHTRQLPRGQ